MTHYRYNAGLAFAALAARTPRNPALRMPGGKAVTYGELNALANRIAALLSQRGVGLRDVVGIVHTKSAECYAAMLAALKLGAAYVNLDDQNPPARLAHIFSTARPKIVCGESLDAGIGTAVKASGAGVVEWSETLADIASLDAAEPPQCADVTGADPAYVMYTSGSTGVPKGACMTHANVLNFGAWCAARFGVAAGDTLTNVNPMYFDNSVFDFYGALLNGAALAPVARDALGDAGEILRTVEEAGCTIWFSVPSLLIYLSTMKVLESRRLPAIRAFVFGGEGYPKPELRRLFAAFSDRATLVNVYGPTECTCICSAWDVSEADLAEPEGLVTLGPVAENFAMLVLDDSRPVGPGEVGELCLLGPQVGAGYLNDAERTAAAFVQNPLNDRFGERMYRTGDLVRLGNDGRSLDFVGRKDNQIKHMGYRIELEEIESALNRIEGISQSAVVQKPGRRDRKILVAYIATKRALTEADARLALETLLPPYMIPQRFEVRESLPKNANGKVDRVALAAE
ncbi:MAG: amino acid adenylation domain-containing protein [Candidatus Eremiobacteraeota bacterium]|nr:amino acid adenylation domain-containing protein [Candidatus Eremiobacteraeota bacterium]